MRELGEQQYIVGLGNLQPLTPRSSIRRGEKLEVDRERQYDAVIADHYRKVAQDFGLSATSTMADEITRRLETEAIQQFVDAALKEYFDSGEGNAATIIDVGCGNGYTIKRLVDSFPTHRFVGIEKSDELRALALSRFPQYENVEILEGDIRNPAFAPAGSADVLICQRVLINLLDARDQRAAFENIISVLSAPRRGRPGGKCLFIEAFSPYLQALNEARAEFDLPEIPSAPHNLYLPEDFLDSPRLRSLRAESYVAPPNFLSTHYYVTRVLHPYLTGDRPFKRNSAFVAFFSQGLKRNIGDFSPVRLHAFERM